MRLRRVVWNVALPVLSGLVAACHNEPVGPEPVASVVVEPDSLTLAVGDAGQLQATVRDGSGAVLSGRAIAWASADESKVAVSSTGLARAVASGRVVVTATSEGKTGHAVVISEAVPQDFAIHDAQFTQGVQAADGSLAMVLDGSAAAVNVLIRSTRTTTTAFTQIVLRLFDDAGNLTRTDTALTKDALGPAPSYASPSAQFLVPASALRPGMKWEVVRDPRGSAPDDTAANDVYPRTGHATLATVSVSTLRIRFVPVVLATHGNATGAVSEGTIPEYLRTLRSVHPIGPIIATIGQPFTTSASFGTPPSGGESGFWQQVLGELDLARIADTAALDAHWYGVVRPPSGFNYTAYGGFAYIPPDGRSTGPGTRTGVGVQINWFFRPTQARDLVGHELAHNWGRRHAPCGGASAPDPEFPNPGGVIGVPGHDVYAWNHGEALSAPTVDASTGDVMGYCFPAWSSAYTWRGIREFRQPVIASPSGVAPVLVVRGFIENRRGVILYPAFLLDARPRLPERAGGYRLEGLAAAGGLLFAYDFEPAALDHDSDVRHFAFAIPLDGSTEEALVELRVRGAAGETRLSRPAAAPAAMPTPAVERVVRGADGLVTVVCADPSARGVLALDARTGQVLGTGVGASLRILAEAGTALTVACSDGVRSARARAVAP